MDTLQNMRAFSCVAEAGSFTAAAVQLDTTTANVSRAVSNLEAHLQTRLLNRTTRRIALTEAGKRYLLRCEQILAYVEEAEAEASDAHARPAGQLKVHTMTGIGQHFVIDAIARYRRTHPDVTFDLTLANRVPDLLDEGYDVSIVLASELPDSGFVSQRLGITYSIACASPDYVKAKGCAQRPQDLLNHACLRLVSPVDASARAPRHSLQPLLEILLPEPGLPGGAMPCGGLAAGNEQQSGIAHALERGFHHAQLGRVAFVVGGIDGQHRGLDALQAGRRVVVT